jgi:hypothetical protein
MQFHDGAHDGKTKSRRPLKAWDKPAEGNVLRDGSMR